MAEDVYSRIVALLDNSDYIANLKVAEKEEELLRGLREAGGTAAVKALKATEAAQKAATKETERATIAAQKAAAASEKAAAKAAQGPSEWTKALQANTAAQEKALGAFRSNVNLGAESLGKLGSALGDVDPQIGGFVQGIQKATGVLSAGASGAQLFGTATVGALSAIAAPAALVAAGFYALELQQEDLEEQSRTLTAQLERLKAGLEGVRDVEEDLVGRELALADPNAAKHLDAAAAAAAKYRPLISATKDAIGAQKEALVEANRELAKWTTGQAVAGYTEEGVAAQRAVATKRVEEATAAIAQGQAQLQGYVEAQGSLAGRLITVTAREKEASDAKKAGVKATKEATEATRERMRVEGMLLKILLEEADAEIARGDSLAQAKESLEDLKRTSERALATDLERIQLAAQASREAAAAAANEAQAASDSSEERKRIAQDLSDTLSNIKAKEDADIAVIDKAAAERARKQAEEDSEQWREGLAKLAETAGDVSDAVFGAITEAQDRAVEKTTNRVEDLQEAYDEAVAVGEKSKAEVLKRQLEAAQEAALAAFEAQKKTATQEAIVQGVLAVATAAASAPPPANLIPMGVAAIIGATQVAAVRAVPPPEFDDTPGAVMAATGQRAQVSLNRKDILIAGTTPESVVRQAADLAGGKRRRIGPQLAKGTLRLLTDDARLATRTLVRRR